MSRYGSFRYNFAALFLVLALLVPLLAACEGAEDETPAKRSFAGKTLELFVGSASKPATEDAAAEFEKATGAKLEVHFGGSGAMLSQIKLAERGDLYFPGSSDFMEKAKQEGLVLPETEQRVVYLIPAINVPSGNAKNIESLEDLARPGVRIGMGRPDTVCVGLYAVEVLEKAGLSDKVRPNIVTQAESCDKTAQLVSLDLVDAVLGWSVFAYWDPDHIETVLLQPAQVPRIGYIPIAISRFCEDKNKEVATAFIDFLISEQGKAIFQKWHYLTSVEDARGFATPDTPVGGEWQLPEAWK